MAGVRYEQDDPRLWSVFNKNKELSEKLAGNITIVFVPRLAKLIPKLSGWGELMDLVKDMRSITLGHVDQHKKSFPENGVPRDFMDAYIKEIEATTDPDSSFYKDNGIRSLAAVVGDLFAAGFETVTLTLSWAVLYLSTFQEVQKKLQEELDSVVGRNRYPTLADRPLLPYVVDQSCQALLYGTHVKLCRIKEYAVASVEHFLNDVFMSTSEFLREANVDIWVSIDEFVKPHVKIVMDFF
ncbi:unnamed protein product [Allacma fusca]|uniref:Uncharacterized protein n=1 Tax=Allacma fusca TaxID=39272 RepID=A0A8J2JLZ3_9HEXA|nr:unnamed protein product [Allacma fusca]